MKECPCASGKEYNECCGGIINNERLASSPEELMRARYSAHALGKAKFLHESLHPSIRGEVNEEEEEITDEMRNNLAWTGLEINETLLDENSGIVDFTANYKVRDIPQRHRERAKFVKEDGAWYYLDGDVEGHVTYKRESPKTGRNDPCSCGSGKKYKKCCALKEE